MTAQTDETGSADTYTNPVDGGIPMGDPFVIRVKDRYFLYGTTAGDGFKCWTSTDLANWTSLGYAFRRDEDTWGRKSFWAPEVVAYRDRFYMVYSSVGEDPQGHRICLAVSDRPEGPFEDVAAPLFDPGHGCIDGHIFIDDDGTPYLFYDKVGATGSPYAKPPTGYMFGIIYAVRLSEDLLKLAGEPVLVQQAEQEWEDPQSMFSRCNEGAFVLKHGDTYYMTYSASHYAKPTYGIGVATAPGPLGPWTKSTANPLARTIPEKRIAAPGHNSLTTSPDGKELFIVYHARAAAPDEQAPRVVFVDRFSFDEEGEMVLHGPTLTPQPLPSGSKPEDLPSHLVKRHEEYEAANVRRRRNHDD